MTKYIVIGVLATLLGAYAKASTFPYPWDIIKPYCSVHKCK